jgi:hypothetical protein
MSVSRERRASAPSRARGRGRRGSRQQQRSIGLAQRARELERALALGLWEAHGEVFGFGNGAGDGEPIEFELRVRVEPGPRWRVVCEPGIAEQLRSAVIEGASRRGAFILGRVYCYRCESAECEHGAPPRRGSVFGGYSSTGLPVWPELPQLLLDRRHPRIDLLYQPARREMIAVYMNDEELTRKQLEVFGRGSRTYRIWGQVVFGYLHIASASEEQRPAQRAALTVQAVEHRRRDGLPRLDLNIIGRLDEERQTVDCLQGPFQLRILEVLADLQRKVAALSPDPRAVGRGRRVRIRADAPYRVADLLQTAARTLEQIGRQRHRRTLHAEVRREANRPTNKALEDAVAAPDDHVLWDSAGRTVIVVGPRKRVHVFSLAGKHITSLTMEPEAVRNRLRRKRWRPLEADALHHFNAAVGRPGEEQPPVASPNPGPGEQ